MFCRECGKEIENNTKFCPECGYNQSEISSDYEDRKTIKTKSKSLTFILCLFLGAIGIHRMYLNKFGSGISMFLFVLITGGWGAILTSVFALVELIAIATSKEYAGITLE